jgi:hypothetical protein
MRLHRVFESMEQPPDIVYQVDNLETAKKLVLKSGNLLPSSLECAAQEEEIQEVDSGGYCRDGRDITTDQPDYIER